MKEQVSIGSHKEYELYSIFFFKFQVFEILLQEKWSWALLQNIKVLGSTWFIY